MLIKCRKLGILSVSLMILLTCAVVGLAADSNGSEEIESLPELPLILKGGLEVNGAPVAAGSEIQAYYGGKLIAESTVKNEGEYVLNLNLGTDNYENLGDVEFYIDGNAADLAIPESKAAAIADEDVPGSIVEMDVQGSVSQPSGSSDGSNSDDENKAVVVTDENVSDSSVDEPEEEPGDEVNADNASGTGNVTEAEAKAPSESSGTQSIIWVVLGFVAVLGAVMIVRKMMAK